MQQNSFCEKTSFEPPLVSLYHYLEDASEEDLASSATLRIFKSKRGFAEEILKTLSTVTERERMLDLGCGYGLAAKMIGTCLHFKEIHGVDIDDKRISVAEQRMRKVHRVDLETEELPFPDGHFDLIISFGVLEHLRFYDNSIKEAQRVLRKNGILVINMPNLGCWVNRFLLLFGFQPRDIDVSANYVTGLPSFWPKNKREAFSHIHACTLSTIIELLKNYGFAKFRTFGVACIDDALKTSDTNRLTKAIIRATDALLSRRPSLSLRFFIVAKKSERRLPTLSQNNDSAICVGRNP